MGPNSEPCSCSSAKRCQTCAVATKLAPASKVEFGQRRLLWDNAAAAIPLHFRFVLEMFHRVVFLRIVPRFDGSVLHGWQCQSRGARRSRGVAHSRDGYRRGAGSAPERTRSVRLLRAFALLVAIVLRSLRRTRHTTAAAMRRAGLLVRGARALASIREGIPGVLPAAGAATRPQYHLFDARSDAGAAPNL